MAYDITMTRLPFGTQVRNIYNKMSDIYDNRTKTGTCTRTDVKHSLGGCATVKYVSKNALSLILKAKRFKLLSNVGRWSCARFDHCIPVNLAVKHLFVAKDNQVLRHAVEDAIKSMAYCILTKDEDDKMRRMKLWSRMPSSWNGDFSVSSMLMRYDVAGIEVIPVEEAISNLKKHNYAK